MAPFLPGKFHGRRTLAGYSSCDQKESDMTEHAHICVFTYNDSPWNILLFIFLFHEAGLQFMGSLRVRQD